MFPQVACSALDNIIALKLPASYISVISDAVNNDVPAIPKINIKKTTYYRISIGLNI